jgi:enamine deaminase RidA (YjgF/YER057c/UK114 family)
VRPINPAELGAPRGYSNGMLAPPGARLLFVAGQVGWDQNQELVGDGFAEQFARALANVVTVVREAGGKAEHLARLTIYVVDRHEYVAALDEIGTAYRGIMGRHYPAMALVEVSALLEPGAKVEIEGTAALPS